jgi:hypothetical protein
MSAKWLIAVFLITAVLFSTAINIVTGQRQKSAGFVKIPEADILPAKSLQNVTASDSGWVFGYDQVGYLKKMAVEDIPTIESFQNGTRLNKKALQSALTADSGYAIGYDGYGNLVKLPLSVIPDDVWRAFNEVNVGVGSGYAFSLNNASSIYAYGYTFRKIAVTEIPISNSLDFVSGADEGYVIGFEKEWLGNYIRKVPIENVPEVTIKQLSTVVAVDSGYVIGLDSRGRLIRVSLSELELGYASSLANRIIDADSGFVVCRVVA